MDTTLEHIKKKQLMRLRAPTPTELFAKAAHNHLATLLMGGLITEDEFNERAAHIRATVCSRSHETSSPFADISYSILFTKARK